MFKAGISTIRASIKIITLESIRKVLSLIPGFTAFLKMSWTIIWVEARISWAVVESVAANRDIIKIPTIQEGRATNASFGTLSLAPAAATAGMDMPTRPRITQGYVIMLFIKEAQNTPRRISDSDLAISMGWYCA